ncbi:hypothetical protein TNCV_5135201 [Trichonephila clavipes]|nr:hypothetical protein TNCV_5135201 [Trichonephila clavipes]
MAVLELVVSPYAIIQTRAAVRRIRFEEDCSSSGKIRHSVYQWGSSILDNIIEWQYRFDPTKCPAPLRLHHSAPFSLVAGPLSTYVVHESSVRLRHSSRGSKEHSFGCKVLVLKLPVFHLPSE